MDSSEPQRRSPHPYDEHGEHCGRRYAIFANRAARTTFGWTAYLDGVLAASCQAPAVTLAAALDAARAEIWGIALSKQLAEAQRVAIGSATAARLNLAAGRRRPGVVASVTPVDPCPAMCEGSQRPSAPDSPP